MSYILKILQDDLFQKTLNIIKKPKTNKLMVGPQGQLHPKALNLRRNLGINPSGMFTTSQVKKVFRTK